MPQSPLCHNRCPGPGLAELEPADGGVVSGCGRGSSGECEAALLQLQVTVWPPLGAVTLNSGGLLADQGWLRVYGGSAGSDGMPSITDVNGIITSSGRDDVELFPNSFPHEGLVIAHDVLGGVFTLSCTDPAAHGQPGEPGDVVYFAPDFLYWVSLEGGYGAWLTWLTSGGLDTFYEALWNCFLPKSPSAS
ncbi:hypothetical protein PoHVEF18_004963 [Penicillium ochrochloron]